jgi:hypothetical protein
LLRRRSVQGSSNPADDSRVKLVLPVVKEEGPACMNLQKMRSSPSLWYDQ